MNCSKNGIKIEGSSCSYNNKCIYPKCINDMNNEYIIVNKTLLEKRIEELEKERKIMWWLERDTLQQIISQSTPLIQEIEAAFGTGARTAKELIEKYNYATSAPIQDAKMEYISNLKLDI